MLWIKPAPASRPYAPPVTDRAGHFLALFRALDREINFEGAFHDHQIECFEASQACVCVNIALQTIGR